MRLKLLALAISVLYIFTGCSDTKEDTSSKKESSVVSTTAPIIEVVANENAQEIKVEEKVKTDLVVKDGKGMI